MIFLAKLQPVVMLVFRQHKDNLQRFAICTETLQRTHQDGLPAYWQKLLGNVSPHAQSLAASHDNDIVHYAIRCLKRIPSAIWSATCGLTSCPNRS